ncbi:MAG: hypothetical protein Ct9H300mP8_12100 [Gammaproteobacteria bacterium]|nr:MAG: hypothetical protein Ct9H300mP8_12100 [Gammaproteobacteria bacterium]
MESAGVGAVHIEDQVAQKRCGHRPNKAIVPAQEMCDRIKAAVDAKTDPSFMVMARTDALAVDGFDAVLDRTQAYVEAGADAIFAEAMTDVSMYGEIVDLVGVPVLANLTEFGATPLYSVDELRRVGVHMALYPLSAFRAMSLAALSVFRKLDPKGLNGRWSQPCRLAISYTKPLAITHLSKSSTSYLAEDGRWWTRNLAALAYEVSRRARRRFARREDGHRFDLPRLRYLGAC